MYYFRHQLKVTKTLHVSNYGENKCSFLFAFYQFYSTETPSSGEFLLSQYQAMK